MTYSRLDVMNYLNDASSSYPDAISFAAGRPTSLFFSTDEALLNIETFIVSYAARTGCHTTDVRHLLAQYGPTVGIINWCIAQQIATDEGIHCHPAEILVTSGAQEAMFLLLPEICTRPGDVLIVRNPTYIGITGAADMQGIEISHLNVKSCSELPAAVEASIRSLRSVGKNPRALYLIPEFDNPSGESLSKSERVALLDICTAGDVVIIEDNPYGMFRFEGHSVSPMRALDQGGTVIYLGTYSKTLCPTLRVGFIVIPMRKSGAERLIGLKSRIEQRKSFSSLNTSQVTQAAVAGTLIKDGFSLKGRVAQAREYYRKNRDILATALHESISTLEINAAIRPAAGGFFLSLHLSRPFRAKEMADCVRQHGVLAMPMAFFAFDESCDNVVRFAYSNVASSHIEEGATRFCNYLLSGGFR